MNKSPEFKGKIKNDGSNEKSKFVSSNHLEDSENNGFNELH